QNTVDHPIFDAHNDFLNSQNELFTSQNTIMEQMTQLTSMCELVCQIVQKKQEEKRIEEEQAANARYWKIPACCDDDDDYDSAITPVLSTEETKNSRSMGDEHLDTISATESDEKKREEKRIEEEQAVKAQSWKFPVCYDDDDDEEGYNPLNDNIISELPQVIKSCVENLVPNPSESNGENGCDVPAGFTTFSNILFDDDYDSDSSDDQSLSVEDVREKIYSNPLFDEEIIPMEIDQHSLNDELEYLITFRFSVGLQTPDDLSQSRLGFIEKMGVHG
nr:hypothetical protein [Tanacetum cinerariifolium]